MSGILRLESLTKGNTLKQGDKTPLKYRLFDADGEKLNIAGKSAKARLVYPDFLTIGYEKDGLTVAQDDTVTFTIDGVIPSRIYHVEIIVDEKFIFPSRADESKFTVDKSSLGTETNIIEIVGKDILINAIKSQVNTELQPLVTSLESVQQTEAQRASAEAQREIDHANRSVELARKADKVILRNLIDNGDVESSFTFPTDSYVSFLNNGDLIGTSVYTLTQPVISTVSGHKYYVRAVFSQGTVRERLYFRYDDNSISDNGGAVIETDMFSGIITADKTANANLRLFGSAGEKTKESIMAIDLTEAFGVGDEPTKEEIDELIQTNGYIDGEYALNNKELLNHLMRGIDENIIDIPEINTLGERIDAIVTGEGLDDGSITPSKTDFITAVSPSVLNKETPFVPGYLDYTTGEFTSVDQRHYTTDFIELQQNVPYKFEIQYTNDNGEVKTTPRTVMLYDSDFNFVRRVGSNLPEVLNFTLSSPEKYIRVNYSYADNNDGTLDMLRLYPVADGYEPITILNESVKISSGSLIELENLESYDQSLNTTDDVSFASISTTGTLPTGTLANPPIGLKSGDAWADTTDSSINPILRVKL